MNLNKNFVGTWNKSTQPRKQRKYRYHAPLHIKQKFMHVHLSPELKKKHQTSNTQLKIKDKVIILRGQFKKKTSKVERINLKREKVYLAGLEKIKKDGTKLLVAFHPSNLMIIELNLDDKKRKQKLESQKEEKEKNLVTQKENKEVKSDTTNKEKK